MSAMVRIPSLACAVLASALFATSPVSAQVDAVPYWASISAEEVNMRVGPAEDYKISWVFKRTNLPLKVVRVKDGWRLVEEPGGAKGWVLGRFLTRTRGAIVQGNGLAEMRERGEDAAPLKWWLTPGITGKLGACTGGWCQFDAGGRIGFVRQFRLWGAGEP